MLKVETADEDARLPAPVTMQERQQRAGDDRHELRIITRWLDGPHAPRGLSVARRTRHGNLLYAYEHRWEELFGGP